MVKFVEITLKDGGVLPVNPERVAFLRRRREDGATMIVFEGVSAGMHEYAAAESRELVQARLEQDDVAIQAQEWHAVEPETAPAKPSRPNAAKPRKRA